jgi:hypothetical protein
MFIKNFVRISAGACVITGATLFILAILGLTEYTTVELTKHIGMILSFLGLSWIIGRVIDFYGFL